MDGINIASGKYRCCCYRFIGCVLKATPHPQHNVDPKNSGVDRAWNKYCQSTLHGGMGSKGLIHFSVCNDRDQSCCSCFALAIFIPSTDPDIDVCTSYCSLNRICSLGLWLWDWGVGVGALGFGLRGVLASKHRRCGGFQGPFRGLFPLPLASVEGLFKHLSRTVRGLFRPLWHWPRTVFLSEKIEIFSYPFRKRTVLGQFHKERNSPRTVLERPSNYP